MGIDTESIRSLAAILDASSARSTMHAAADELDALRAEVKRLRKRVGALTMERDLYLDSHDKANDFAQAICSLLGLPSDCWDFYNDLLEPLEDLKRDRDCLLAKDSPCKP